MGPHDWTAGQLIEALMKLDPDTPVFTHSCCYGAEPVQEVGPRIYMSDTRIYIQ